MPTLRERIVETIVQKNKSNSLNLAGLEIGQESRELRDSLSANIEVERIESWKLQAQRIFQESGVLQAFTEISHGIANGDFGTIRRHAILRHYSLRFDYIANLYLAWGNRFSIKSHDLVNTEEFGCIQMIDYEKPILGLFGDGIEDYQLLTATLKLINPWQQESQPSLFIDDEYIAQGKWTEVPQRIQDAVFRGFMYASHTLRRESDSPMDYSSRGDGGMGGGGGAG